MAKKLISEQTVLETARRGEKVVYCEADAIVTDAARDRASQLGVSIQRKDSKQIPSHSGTKTQIQPVSMKETIAIGSDHGGFSLKEQLKPFLASLGYNVIDLGTSSEESCDYPDFAFSVAAMVMKGSASRGIIIDSVGTASAMAANKIPGIRAACCFDEYSARSSREHNNSNIMTLGGKVIGIELARSIVKIWLETSYAGGRHQKRLDKISDIEKKFLK